MTELNFWREPMSPCGNVDCRGGWVLISHNGGYAYDTCGPCESRVIFAQEEQRRDREQAAKQWWAEPVAPVHPDYPF
jgi:hypothetical protein